MSGSVKREHSQGTGSLLWATVWRYRLQSLAVVVMLVVAGLAEGIGLVSLLPLLDEAAGSAGGSAVGDVLTDFLGAMGLGGGVGALLAVIVVAILTKALVTMAAHRYAGHVAARVTTDLRVDLLSGLMKAEWSYFVNQPLGEIANSMSGEAIRASHVFTHGTRLLSNFVQLVVFSVLALVVSWQVAVTAMVVGVIMMVSLNSLVRMARSAGRTETVMQQRLVGRLADALSGIKPLKAMGLEAVFWPRLKHETEEIDVAYRRKATSTAILGSVHEPIAVLFMAVMLYVLITQFNTPIAELVFVSFLFYRVLTRVGGIQSMYQKVVLDESALASIHRTVREANLRAETHTGDRLASLTRSIDFMGVSFSYRDSRVLSDVTFQIEVGTFCTLSGPSGVGKSTTADLILGLQRPDSGRILIDGVDLASIDIAAWRRRIGYVPQEVVLFHDSVFMNVGLGLSDVGRSDVERALKQADLWDFVASLKDGLDTVVGERGARLSGGQRQRLAMARALIRRPDLLILDEATTGLDPVTEAAIIATLRSLGSEVTILAISHQQALVDAADKVLTMDSGSIVNSEPAAADQTRR